MAPLVVNETADTGVVRLAAGSPPSAAVGLRLVALATAGDLLASLKPADGMAPEPWLQPGNANAINITSTTRYIRLLRPGFIRPACVQFPKSVKPPLMLLWRAATSACDNRPSDHLAICLAGVSRPENNDRFLSAARRPRGGPREC